MSTPLSAISNILSSGIANIESAYVQRGVPFPSLDEPFRPSEFDDGALMETTNLVLAAAAQLIAMLKPPHQTLGEGGMAHYTTASLGVVTAANIPEILREAGPNGLHIKRISEKCGVDPQKIGRVLRFLATNHIFQEVAVDVFANNRISSVLDTGKSLAAIKEDPLSKHNNTNGLAAVLGHNADESMKASSYLTESLLDPKISSSQDPLDCPFSLAHGRESIFDFFEKPENEKRFRRFDAAMHGTSSSIASDIIVTGFDWSSLKKDEVAVDVGGGIGSATLMLAKAFPHLRFVIQDRPLVVESGINFWKTTYPEALENDRVQLQPHDFFAPQTIKDASVFFLRYVMHDWPDKFAKNILSQLRTAARPDTKMIIMDLLIPYTAPCTDEFSFIPGASIPEAPYPLLPNLGTVSNPAIMMDMQMMMAVNAQERTVGQFVDLVDGTGWKIESISRSPKSALSLLIFTAA